MSSGGAIQAREAVFPTRQVLGQMKSKLKGAQTGHDLLKRKSEALTKCAMPAITAPPTSHSVY
ncbi:ATPase V1/A1 complex subunit D [Lasiodiplodia theobromae]|nr:ATPase V1/A1 complex subunit D [Lasiodiplodia theobromae]